MKGQWGLLFAFIFALIVAIFAVINVDKVTVDYLFGTAQWPLVLVILASALLGALVVGGFGIFRVFRSRWEIRGLKRENVQLREELERLKNTIAAEEEKQAEDIEPASSASDAMPLEEKENAVPEEEKNPTKP